MVQIEERQPKRQRIRKSDHSGAPRRDSRRSERVVVLAYPSDVRDLEVLASAWNVPLSTLCWSVLHDWLQSARGISSDLVDARGGLRLALDVALRDRQLGPWLRAEFEKSHAG